MQSGGSSPSSSPDMSEIKYANVGTICCTCILRMNHRQLSSGTSFSLVIINDVGQPHSYNLQK